VDKVFNKINCEEIKSNEELFALTRDGNYRENPDELLYGFFAAWPAILLIMAG
jgi:hypothetical protein